MSAAAAGRRPGPVPQAHGGGRRTPARAAELTP
jgi:hypothetical protein